MTTVFLGAFFFSSELPAQDFDDVIYDSERYYDPLNFEWKNISVDSTILAENLEFSLKNNNPFSIKAVPTLECKGLLVKQAKLDLPELYLGAGEERSVSVPAESIPLQTANAANEVHVSVDICSENPNIAYSWSTVFPPAYYYHSEDALRIVIMNSIGFFANGSKRLGGITLGEEIDEQEPLGYLVDDNGGLTGIFPDDTSLEMTSDDGRVVGRIVGRELGATPVVVVSNDSVSDPTPVLVSPVGVPSMIVPYESMEPWLPPPPEPPVSTAPKAKFCATWNTWFHDSDQEMGDDYLTDGYDTVGTTYQAVETARPAKHATGVLAKVYKTWLVVGPFQIMPVNVYVIVWQGTLDNDGCTPTVYIESNTQYSFSQGAILKGEDFEGDSWPTCSLLVVFACLSCSTCSSSKAEQDGGADSGSEEIVAPSFVSVEGGTFTMGSPETEPCRGAYAEDLIESVTLTYPFAVSRTEVTQEQWESLGFPNPSHHVCPKCPVHMVNWYEAAAYCNELSTREGLSPCYDMSSCEGTVGGGCSQGDAACSQQDAPTGKWYECTSDIQSKDNYWECEGYRLPTVAEWEYAARAGTSTATYNGDLPSDLDGCGPQGTVDPIAWHCNLADHVMPVGLLQPNAWGLYDALGNAEELTDTSHDGQVLGHGEQELVNPIGPGLTNMIIVKGNSWGLSTCNTRSAWLNGTLINARFYLTGFRVVRTLKSVGEGPSDPPPEPRVPEFDDGDGEELEWVSIPGGEYAMGSKEDDAPDEELPAHTVTVADFWLARSEVTVLQYGDCVEAGQCSEPYDGPMCNFGWEGVGSHPVNCVDLEGARSYCAWVGGRLPTEAEWEHAARNGGIQVAHPWGEEEASCEVVSMNEDGEYACGLGSPGPVCSFEGGDTIDGLCDMLGSVWEWVEDDWHYSYEEAPTDGSAWMGGGPPGVGTRRGGSFDLGARDLYSRRRDGLPSSARYFNTGFRCAKD